jgi:hypothetical protein
VAFSRARARKRGRRCSTNKILDLHSLGGRCNYGRRMANRYQYTVVELREGMIGGKMSGGQLEKVLNEHAAHGNSKRSPPSKSRAASGRAGSKVSSSPLNGRSAELVTRGPSLEFLPDTDVRHRAC